MKNGHIAAVEVLENAPDDEVAVKRGSVLFVSRVAEGYEGFEIWERERLVFRYPTDDGHTEPKSGEGRRFRAAWVRGWDKKAAHAIC